jgi:phosphoglycerol transferase
VFSLLVTAWVRAYNRVSVFVAFFALALVAWALDRLLARWSGSRRGRFALYGLLALLLFGGAYDQTSPAYSPNHPQIRERFAADARFVHAVEEALPPGSMVLQLPYVPFPEHPTVYQLRDYDHARLYFHSRSLRWSYGAVKGRESDLWQETAWLQPTEDLVKMAALAGFGGIYVNRDGFPDDGKAITGNLDGLLGVAPIVSENGRLCVYDLADYTRRLRAALGDGWDAASDAARHPALFRWKRGFSYLEGVPGHQWRWCSAEGDLLIDNGSSREKRLAVEMAFTTATGAPARLTLRGLGIDEELTIDGGGDVWKRVLVIPPGQHRIHFASDAAPVPPGIDPRDLHFRVENFSAREFGEVPAP